MNLTNRTGQVWIDRSFCPRGEVFLVIGPSTYCRDIEADALHQVVVFDSDDYESGERVVWRESEADGEWEFHAEMERIA